VAVPVNTLESIDKQTLQDFGKVDAVHRQDHRVRRMRFFGRSKKRISVGIDEIVPAGAVDADIEPTVVGHFG
jgi:hypothetical protein